MGFISAVRGVLNWIRFLIAVAFFPSFFWGISYLSEKFLAATPIDETEWMTTNLTGLNPLGWSGPGVLALLAVVLGWWKFMRSYKCENCGRKLIVMTVGNQTLQPPRGSSSRVRNAAYDMGLGMPTAGLCLNCSEFPCIVRGCNHKASCNVPHDFFILEQNRRLRVHYPMDMPVCWVHAMLLYPIAIIGGLCRPLVLWGIGLGIGAVAAAAIATNEMQSVLGSSGIMMLLTATAALIIWVPIRLLSLIMPKKNEAIMTALGKTYYIRGSSAPQNVVSRDAYYD